jgi:AraC-like DNA-binding protein
MNNLISLLLIGSLLLLIFLAFSNPNKVNIRANLWFGAFLLCIFILSTDSIYVSLGLNMENVGIQSILSISSNFLAPLFYLSICYFIKPNRVWRTSDYFHFLFGVLFCIFIVSAFLMITDTKQIENNDKSFVKIFEILSYLFTTLFIIQMIGYGYLTYKKLQKHQEKIKLFSSNTKNIDLKWLQNIVLAVNLLIVIWIPDMLLGLSSNKFSIINFFLLIGIFFIGYHFIKQKEIYPFSEIQKQEIIEIIDESDSLENKKKLIDDQKLQELKTDLSQLMATKKPFLDSEISLVKLSSEMQITPHILSYIINKGFEENFYQFINRFRIEEAKKLLLDPDKNYLSLLGIGFEVGFNSKSVFNTTFKKISNQTPSEFKKTNTQL